MIKRCISAFAVGAILSVMSASAHAQSVTTAFEGFNGRSNAPVNIEADRLEVREKDEAAIFTGNVVVVQGESTLRTKLLTIYYVGEVSKDKKEEPAKQAPVQGKAQGESSALPTGRDIRKLEAEGDVVVVSGEQRATGGKGVFDMKSNTVVLSGNVVVSQGQNVLRGDRLVVNLTAQTSRLESVRGGNGGRVQGLFMPGARK
jgi:lipopolysaccharide export system protein LptA